MRKILPYFLVLFALAALVVSGVLFLNPERFRTQITASLSQRLKHKVVIGKIEAAYFPPSLHLHHIVVLNASEDKPLLQAEDVYVQIAWKQILHKRFVPDRLRFDHWLLYAERRQDGSWDWGEWLNPASSLDSTDGWPLDVVSFENGECHLTDPYASSSALVVRSISAELRRKNRFAKVSGLLQDLPAPVRVSFEGAGQFVVAPEWKGALQLSADNQDLVVHLDRQPSQLVGRIESKAWPADIVYTLFKFYARQSTPIHASVPAQNWNGQFSVFASSLVFTQSFEAGSGRVESQGRVNYSAAGPQLHLEWALKDVQVLPFEQMLGWSTAWTGALTGIGQADLVLSSASWSTLQGQGALALSNGQFRWTQTLTKSLAKAHLMAYMKKKYPDLLTSGLPVRKASGRWQASAGQITVDDGFVDFGELQVGLVGRYDGPRDGVEGYARLLVKEKSPALVALIPPSYVYRGNGGTVIQPMHGIFQGVGNDLTLRARRQSKLPAAVLTKLKNILH